MQELTFQGLVAAGLVLAEGTNGRRCSVNDMHRSERSKRRRRARFGIVADEQLALPSFPKELRATDALAALWLALHASQK
jgi:hypothetical protein